MAAGLLDQNNELGPLRPLIAALSVPLARQRPQRSETYLTIERLNPKDETLGSWRGFRTRFAHFSIGRIVDTLRIESIFPIKRVKRMFIEILRPSHLKPLQLREGETVTWLQDTCYQKFCRVIQRLTADFACSGTISIGFDSVELDFQVQGEEPEPPTERERRQEVFAIEQLRKSMESQRVRK